MAVTVRWGRAGDAEALAEIHVRGWQEGYAGLLPQDLLDGLRPSDRLARWSATLAASDPPRRGTLVAELDGSLAGFASVGPLRGGPDADDGLPAPGAPNEPAGPAGDQSRRAPAGVGEVYSFYVDPAHWRRGLGTALMEAATAALRGAGYGEAILWVLEGNDAAVAFYRHTGWVLDGGRTADEIGGRIIHDLRMTHPLRTI